MTERLHHLLHDEADRVAVPVAPAPDVLSRGRGLRRRRRLSAGAAALATVVVLVGGVTLWSSGDRAPRAIDPAAPADAVTAGAAFSIGPTVYLDDGRVSATVDDVTVKSLYYTSAGVLVRHGENNYSDGGGPQRFSLVRPDGSVSPVGIETEETVHATDPDQPYVAYAQRVDGKVHVLVRDVGRDEQVADVVVPRVDATFLPVSLDGDLVYLGNANQMLVVDWRSGDTRISPFLAGSATVSGGRAVTYDDVSPVVDATTGEPALTIVDPEDAAAGSFYQLSPSGRYVMHEVMSQRTPGSFEIFGLDDGSRGVIDGNSYEYGWTSTDELFRVGDGTLSICSPEDGTCEDTVLDLAVQPGTAEDFSDNLQLGGRAYES